MEMWQIDGLEYRLFDQDATKATIYQLLDDGTRFDVGTRCFARPENSDDAITTLLAGRDLTLIVGKDDWSVPGKGAARLVRPLLAICAKKR